MAEDVTSEGEHRVDPDLPQVPLPHAAALLQIYTELLPLHRPGYREVRCAEGHFYGRAQGAPLSPVRQGRLRPGQMSMKQ